MDRHCHDNRNHYRVIDSSLSWNLLERTVFGLYVHHNGHFPASDKNDHCAAGVFESGHGHRKNGGYECGWKNWCKNSGVVSWSFPDLITSGFTDYEYCEPGK